MFIGEYSHSMDTKGRLAIPAKFRDELEQGAVVTKGIDNCLTLYPAQEWEKIADKISQLPVSQSNTRAFSRHMLAGAMDVLLDGQGRIIIPDYLRKYAGIEKKAVITGLYNRLEIWDEDQWQAYKAQTEYESENIAETLADLNV
jgi:MraZ protein